MAGDRNVGVNGGQMARQCLEAGLLDEIGVELVPVVLGAGKHLLEGLTTPVRKAPSPWSRAEASLTSATGS